MPMPPNSIAMNFSDSHASQSKYPLDSPPTIRLFRLTKETKEATMTLKRLAVAAAVGMMVCLPNLPAAPQQANKPPVKRSIDKKPLTEEQKILHVLNRLGFGPRPGDVERVKAMGLKSYIEKQLNPEKIADEAV